MKILQLYKDFYPPVIGGIESHINVLSKGLIEQGVDVEILVSNTRPTLERKVVHGIKVTKAPEFGRYSSTPINPSLPKLIRELSADVDLLHFHIPNPAAVCAYGVSGLKKPFVVTYHSDIVRQAKLKKIYWPFQKAFLEKADAIIATSPNYIESSNVLQRFKKKCIVVPIGIDTKRFDSTDDAFINMLLRQYGNRLVLFIGKFRYYKGLSVLIDAMRYVEGNLVIIGDGPLRKSMTDQIKVYGLENKIRLLGELPNDNVTAFLKACKVFVLPSVLRSEAYGIVLAEAMVCGKPVVSTELGTGTSYVNLHKKTGLVIPPNNSKILATAITYLIENPKENLQYGEAGKKRIIQGFSAERMVNETIDIYEKITASKF